MIHGRQLVDIEPISLRLERVFGQEKKMIFVVKFFIGMPIIEIAS